MQASGFVAVYECKYGKPGRQRVAVMSPLLRVFSGKLIGMAQYHLKSYRQAVGVFLIGRLNDLRRS